MTTLHRHSLTAIHNSTASKFSHWCKSEEVEALEAKLKVLSDYASATQYWKLKPHDQKERNAYLAKILLPILKGGDVKMQVPTESLLTRPEHRKISRGKSNQKGKRK